MPLDPNRVQAVLLSACECHEPADLATVLDRECFGDAELRERVEALLRAGAEPGNLLDQPVVNPRDQVNITSVESSLNPSAFTGGIFPDDRESALELADSAGDLAGSEADGTLYFKLPPDLPDSGGRPAPAVSGYEILGELGHGGMGVVYKARQIRLDRPCALKMILGGGHASAESAARFLAEAKSIAQLQHPHIVQIYHIGDADGLPFFELEYLPGGSLDRRLKGTPWPARRAAELIETLARAVAEAHRQGIVHRDLKPGNVLMAADGTPKLTDFGLAKSLAADSGLTRTDSIMGSPGYMAPEQAEGKTKQVGPLADVYALGAILYELLTGGPPFRGTTALEILDQVKNDEPVAPSRLVPGLPRDVETIALKCLQKEPEKRYDSAIAVADDLRRFLDGEPIVARPVGSVARLRMWCLRNRSVAALAGLAALLLTLVAIVSLIGYVRTTAALGRERDALRKQRSALGKERDALSKAHAARQEAVRNLYHAQVGQARALRTARLGGYRASVFDLLGRAAQLEIPDRDPGELRREASASLGDFVGLQPTVIGGPSVRPAAGTANSRQSPRLALHPRSEWLAIGLADGTVRFMDLAGGKERARLAAHNSPVSALAPTPEGRLLVGHADGTIRVVEDERGLATSGTTLRPKAGGPVRGFFPVAGGRTLVVGGGPTAMTISNFDGSGAMTLDFAQSVPGRLGGSLAAADTNLVISPDGRLAATGLLFPEPPDLEVVLWELAAPRRVRHASLKLLSSLSRLAFSPDSTRLAVGGDLGFAVLDVADLTPRLAVSLDSADALAFGPDGNSLAVGTISRLVKLWSLKTNRELAELRYAGSNTVSQVALSSDGRTLAAGGVGSVQVWNLAAASERMELAGHDLGITSVAFSPDGATLASTSKEGPVKLWDPAANRLLRTLGGYPGDVQACAFSPDGSLLATGSFESGRVRIWDARNWKEAYCATDPGQDNITGLAFGGGADLGLLAATSARGLRIWWVRRTGDPRPALRQIAEQFGEPCYHVALSPDGARAAYIMQGLPIKLWDVAHERGLPFSGPRALNGWHALAFRSPRELVYIANDRTAVIWDVAENRLSRAIGSPGTFDCFHIAVSPDRRWLAAEPTPSSVAIVDLERGEIAFTFREERSAIWSLAWSPNGRRLALGLSDGGLVLWDLEQVRARLAESGIDAPSTTTRKEVPQPARAVPALQLEQVASLHQTKRDLAARAAESVRSSRWDAAATAYLALVELTPDNPSLCNRLAIARLSAGDWAGYGSACATVLKRFAQGADRLTADQAATDAKKASQVAWTCALAPSAAVDPAAPLRLAELAVKSLDAEEKPRALDTLGASLYRAGRFEDAILRLEEGINLRNGVAEPHAWPFLAMANHRLGHRGESHRWLDKLRNREPSADADQLWNELEIRLLRSEAEALILYDPVFPADPFTR